MFVSCRTNASHDAKWGVWRVSRGTQDEDPYATCVSCGEVTNDLADEGDNRATW